MSNNVDCWRCNQSTEDYRKETHFHGGTKFIIAICKECQMKEEFHRERLMKILEK